MTDKSQNKDNSTHHNNSMEMPSKPSLSENQMNGSIDSVRLSSMEGHHTEGEGSNKKSKSKDNRYRRERWRRKRKSVRDGNKHQHKNEDAHGSHGFYEARRIEEMDRVKGKDGIALHDDVVMSVTEDILLGTNDYVEITKMVKRLKQHNSTQFEKRKPNRKKNRDYPKRDPNLNQSQKQSEKYTEKQSQNHSQNPQKPSKYHIKSQNFAFSHNTDKIVKEVEICNPAESSKKDAHGAESVTPIPRAQRDSTMKFQKRKADNRQENILPNKRVVGMLPSAPRPFTKIFETRKDNFHRGQDMRRMLRKVPNSVLQHKFPCIHFNTGRKCTYHFGIESGKHEKSCPHIHCYYNEICKHYFSERGCARGDECNYLHCSMKASHLSLFWKLQFGSSSSKTYMTVHQKPSASLIEELHFWDFDNTLFNTYTREQGLKIWKKTYPNSPWPEDIGYSWWGNSRSLEHPFDNVEVGPAFAECLKEVKEKKKSVLTIMMTGRIFSLKSQVLEIINGSPLPVKSLSHCIFKPEKWSLGTLTYKCAVIMQYLGEYKNTKKIEIWEDRLPHVAEFYYLLTRELKKLNVNLVIHYVAPISKELLQFQKENLYSDTIVVTE